MPISPEILRQFTNSVFVETGTYLGVGSEVAESVGFGEIHTIDIDSALVSGCRSKWSGRPIFHVYCGSSNVLLPKIIGGISGRITFWLDAHPPGELNLDNTPLSGELEVIRDYCKTLSQEMCPTVLIDDMRCFSAGCVERLEKMCESLYPGCEVGRIDTAWGKGDILYVRPGTSIPERERYTMGGAIPIYTWMFNERDKDVSDNYSAESVMSFRDRIQKRDQNYYGETDSFLYQAMDRFPVSGKSVLVYGSETPWYEVMALEFGAKDVTVVEYNNRRTEIPNVRYVKPTEIEGKEFDCVFSISSFEHDGLGRYGDPLDPDGDLKAMWGARRHIRPGGVMFLSVPVGRDALVWNAHRIYGPLRMPLLLRGWRVVSSFGLSFGDYDRAFSDVTKSGTHQPVIVLKEKISTLVFSKDRPLFLDAHLETMVSAASGNELDVTVYFLATSDRFLEAYVGIQKRHPDINFVRQNGRGELVPFLRAWLKDAGRYVLVTVDDNVYGGLVDADAIERTLLDEDVFGFTLRLHPGIRHTQVEREANDPGPASKGRVTTYEPHSYGLPWSYVWEMSSTVYRKESLLSVLDSGKSILSVNDLETIGLSLFPSSRTKKMACFNWAPTTNVFVDSWLSPHVVSNPISNDVALDMYREGRRIDVDETFRNRDENRTTHVKELFLKKRLDNSAIVVVPSYNCEKWTEKCLMSVLGQTYPDMGIIFIDDASTDKTAEIARRILSDRKDVVFLENRQRQLAMRNHVVAIRDHCSNPESVIFTVDGDDWLDSETAIERMMERHRVHDVVWSRYRRTDSSNEIASGPLIGGDVRGHSWVSSHLRSFKKFLFDGIKDEDFRNDDGHYYKMTCDVAIMFPILEMTPPERRLFYDSCLYVYNRETPANDDKQDIGMQMQIEKRIRAGRRYPVHPRYKSKGEWRMKRDKTPQVSIVIPCCNYGKYLRDSIQSVMDQTHKNHELIMIDYGSNDDTASVMGEYKQDAVVLSVPNRGYPNARNIGISVAKGEYVLCLDADDKLLSDFVERVMERATPKTIIATWGQYFGDRSDIFLVEDASLASFWSSNRILSCSLFPKKMWEEVGGYDEAMKQLEDWDFWLRAMVRGYVVDVVPKALVMVRSHSDSVNVTESFHRWKKHLLGKMGHNFEFDEEEYLRLNPDVRDSVARREISSGWEHYVLYGCRERDRMGASPELGRLTFDVVSAVYRSISSKR